MNTYFVFSIHTVLVLLLCFSLAQFSLAQGAKEDDKMMALKEAKLLVTSSPSVMPSSWPSSTPSATPTSLPTASPSSFPSDVPSWTPTSTPSGSPSGAPSKLQKGMKAKEEELLIPKEPVRRRQRRSVMEIKTIGAQKLRGL